MKYRVWAKMTSYAYLDVEAENKDEAYEIALQTDGGEFIPESEYAASGDWELNYDQIEEVE